MTSINDKLIEDYVASALLVAGYRLEAAEVAQVTEEFRRIATIASALLDPPLPIELEPLPVFRP